MKFFIPFISIFYLVGFGMLGASLWNAWRSARAGSWPTTSAKITSVELDRRSDGDGGDAYQVNIHYSYEVLGETYEGSRLAFGYGSSSDRDAHWEIYQRLRKAEGVDVRYDPGNPAVSCLSYGIHRSIQICLAFSATWLAFVFGFTLLFWLFSLPDTALLKNLSLR